MDLETAALTVPVLPTSLDNLPPEIVDYLLRVNDYLQAVHRDIQKLGGTP